MSLGRFADEARTSGIVIVLVSELFAEVFPHFQGPLLKLVSHERMLCAKGDTLQPYERCPGDAVYILRSKGLQILNFSVR